VFDAGSEPAVFEIRGRKVGINICYDLNFRESVEMLAAAGAALLVCPCNNMMSRGTAERWKSRHHEIRSQRARESGAWLLSADVTGETEGRVSFGPTALIDPAGAVVAQVPLMTTGMVVADVG
jgi:predicted amidohydrolase